MNANFHCSNTFGRVKYILLAGFVWIPILVKADVTFKAKIPRGFGGDSNFRLLLVPICYCV